MEEGGDQRLEQVTAPGLLALPPKPLAVPRPEVRGGGGDEPENDLPGEEVGGGVAECGVARGQRNRVAWTGRGKQESITETRSDSKLRGLVTSGR